MATLKLKKKVPILQKPLADVQGKFAVARQRSSPTKTMRFTCSHDTMEQAQTEAERLLIENPDGRYLILQIVGAIGV